MKSLPAILVSASALLALPAAVGQKSTWWSFQPVRAVAPPASAGTANPIDAFVLQKLRARGLTFAPIADRRTLIRRLSFDLLGLPPIPEEVETFVADKAPDAWGRLVDKMLASPHYGERWGRKWLDVVRFGETDGGEHNFERFNAWPYRDYVIDSLNSDLPYNQFIKDQIAGDALFPGDRKKLAATGLLVAGPWDQVSAVLTKDPVLRKQARMDELDDMVTTVGATFLGLTVNCARCHDHKFDPIPTKDYYRLTAVFSGAGFGERDIASAEERKEYESKAGPLQRELGKVRRELEEMEEPVSTKLLFAKYRKYDSEHDSEPQRMPLNPIFNRNRFAAVSAKHWRLRIFEQHRGRVRLARLEVQPAGFVVKDFAAVKDASTDKPVEFVWNSESPVSASEIWWSVDPVRGKVEGTPKVYKLECSDDGTQWRTVCSNTDHMSSLEADLPTASDAEISEQMSSENRERRKSLATRRAALSAELGAIPAPTKLYSVTSKKPETANILERGSAAKVGAEVSPGVLTALHSTGDLQTGLASTDLERRTALAEWVASSENPLTARVMVNRVWQGHFGNGIVNTPSDFGLMGDRPSHPELLDWLAADFVRNGWSLKKLHRRIVTSRTYLQSDQVDPKAHAADAGNRLLWHMPLKRMDAETLRDSILRVTGSLNPKMGGPSFFLQDKGSRGSYIYKALHNDGPDVWRRSVYRFVVRGGDRIFLDSFDCPDPSVATPVRPASNTPVQALALLNNAFVLKQAEILAKRVQSEVPGNPTGQVSRAFTLAFGRRATSRELETAVRFLKTQPLSIFCRALLNSNEFVFVP